LDFWDRSIISRSTLELQSDIYVQMPLDQMNTVL